MNVRKKITCILLVVLGMTASLSALDLSSILSADELKELNSDNLVFRVGKTREGLFYIPDVPLAKNIREQYNSIHPDVTVEAYFRIPYPEGMASDPNRNLKIYNILREVSKISGVQYFSRTKQKYRVLFDDVYAVDKDRNPVVNKPVTAIRAYDSFSMHMKEAHLGQGFYKAEYYYDGTDFSFSMTNTSKMSYIFKVVGEGNMQIDLLLIPEDKDILLYGYCGVKLANPFFVKKIMDPYSSFFRRLYAMEIWFSNSLLGTDDLPDKDIMLKQRD